MVLYGHPAQGVEMSAHLVIESVVFAVVVAVVFALVVVVVRRGLRWRRKVRFRRRFGR